MRDGSRDVCVSGVQGCARPDTRGERVQIQGGSEQRNEGGGKRVDLGGRRMMKKEGAVT